MQVALRWIWWGWLAGSALLARAQVKVSWEQLPAPLQLYPRDSLDKAEVPIAGRLQSTLYSHVSVRIFRNGNAWKYLRVPLAPTATEASFRLNPVIEAGLNEYRFQVYALAGRDSVLLATRDRILCGDVYLLAGQSNITGFYPENYTYQNKFLRSIGQQGPRTDSAWYQSNLDGRGQVGLIGTELQRMILEQFGMPTCFINGGEGGTSVTSHTKRNPKNPADVKTLYGALLYRAQQAGVSDKITAMIWRQGESEAGGGDAGGYDKHLDTLFANWQTDYPNLKKFYVVQVNLMSEPNPGAGKLRDIQRRTALRYPRTEAVASVGLVGFDGVHYHQSGHYQFAREMLPIIARDFYRSRDTIDVSSPAIAKVYYRTAEKKEVVLQFGNAVEMRWKQDTVISRPDTGAAYTMDLRDFFYLDYANTPRERMVESATVQGNRLILSLKQAVDARDITYLPNFYSTPQAKIYTGPLVKNSRGMRALTFYKVAIAPALEVRLLVAVDSVSDRRIDLSWETTAGRPAGYRIERAENSGGPFRAIGQVDSATVRFSDLSVTPAVRSYFYRITAVNAGAESDYSNVVEVVPPAPVLVGIPESVSTVGVYPVPARTTLRCELPTRLQAKPVLVSLINGIGQTALRQALAAARTIELNVSAIPAGLYHLVLRWDNETISRKVLIQ